MGAGELIATAVFPLDCSWISLLWQLLPTQGLVILNSLISSVFLYDLSRE